jgi:hypothetical protein
MTTTGNFTNVGTVRSDEFTLTVYFGDLFYRDEVYKNGAIKLILIRTADNKRMAKTFKGEMAHWDADRWVNDVVKYPNLFAGLLTTGAFDGLGFQ